MIVCFAYISENQDSYVIEDASHLLGFFTPRSSVEQLLILNYAENMHPVSGLIVLAVSS